MKPNFRTGVLFIALGAWVLATVIFGGAFAANPGSSVTMLQGILKTAPWTLLAAAAVLCVVRGILYLDE